VPVLVVSISDTTTVEKDSITMEVEVAGLYEVLKTILISIAMG
jgi:hypothetical protein